MRTARTIGIKPDGTEVLIHGSSVPLAKQAGGFREMSVKGIPKDYAEVHFQRSDGVLKRLRNGVNAAVKDAQARIKDKLENSEKWIKQQAEFRNKAVKAAQAERQKQIDAVNAPKEAAKKAKAAAAQTTTTTTDTK